MDDGNTTPTERPGTGAPLRITLSQPVDQAAAQEAVANGTESGYRLAQHLARGLGDPAQLFEALRPALGTGAAVLEAYGVLHAVASMLPAVAQAYWTAGVRHGANAANKRAGDTMAEVGHLWERSLYAVAEASAGQVVHIPEQAQKRRIRFETDADGLIVGATEY